MEKFSHWRIGIIQVSFIIFSCLVILFLYKWQVVEHDKYEAYAQQRFRSEVITSLRGPILSKSGSPLAYSIPVYDLYVYIPNVVEAEGRNQQTREELVSHISKVLKIKKENIEEKLSGPIGNVLIKKEILSEEKDLLENYITKEGSKLSGIDFETKEKRVYTDTFLASQVLGFVGKTQTGDDIGAYGIEGYWEGDLKWKEGLLYEERDNFGNQIVNGELDPIRPKVGRTITVTIDRGVQQIVEEELKEMVDTWHSRKASAIVMDPRTGAIIAMANYPTYDGNKYWEVDNTSVLNNFAVSDPYEFGSVGKSFTASVAMDLELYQPNDVLLDSHEGCTTITEGITSWEICTSSKKPHGPLTVLDTLKESDNLGAYEMARKIGPERMYSYLSKFGFGYISNVGLAEENTSYLKEWEDWNKTDIATYSFGQGYSGTALQVLSAESAIANDGVRMQPYIVSNLKDDNTDITIKPRIAAYVISEEAAEKTTDMLVEVFDSWNAKNYYPELGQYRIAAKSGTAQVVDETGMHYSTDKVANTIIGYDASPDPKFVMIINQHEPDGIPFAIYSVLPTWTETFLRIKDLLGVVPYTEE